MLNFEHQDKEVLNVLYEIGNKIKYREINIEAYFQELLENDKRTEDEQLLFQLMQQDRKIFTKFEEEEKFRIKILSKEFNMPIINRDRYFDWDTRPIHYWEFNFKKIYFPIHVAEDIIGNYRISTVWLGIDHSFYKTAHPVIFETMIFPIDDSVAMIEELKGYQERYSYLRQSEIGHRYACDVVEALLKVEQ